MSFSAGSSPRSRDGRATQGQTRGRSPLSASPSHLNLPLRPPEAPRDSSPLLQLIAAPSTSSSALSPRSRPLQPLHSALNAPPFSASASGGSGSGSGGGGGGSERASAAYTDFIVRPDEPTCSVLERPAAPLHDAALSHELRALSADVRSGQARQEARHQEVMGALRHIAGGMMSARAAPQPQLAPAPPPPSSSSLRSHLGLGAPPARGTALNAPRPVSPQVAITPPTPYKPAVRGVSSYAGASPGASCSASSAPSPAPAPHSVAAPSSAAEPAFALSQPSVRISILTLLDGSQISLCISRSDTPTPLPANGAAPDPQSGDYRKFLIPTATLLSSLQKTYDFVLSTRKPAPVQQNMSAPGAAPSYATMSGMTNPSRLRSSTASTSMSEQSTAAPTSRVPDTPAPSMPQDAASQRLERARQESLKRPLEEPATEASSSVIRPTRYVKSRRSQPHTGGLEMAGHPKWMQPARDESSASGFRLQWPDYDNPESLVAEPVDRHRPPTRGSTASRSTTPWPQASASQRTASGPQYNGHATMPFLDDATGRPVSRASTARGSEHPSDPATSPQQVAPSHTVDADVSSPEASASEVQEERLIRANLMAALREAGFDEMSQADREELLISTCLAQHRGAKRRLLALQRNNENANRETNMAREAERRANATVQQLQLELQRKQEEDDTRRSALERSNADLQTELQQLRAHVQRINTHALHGDYLRLGPESAENSQEAFGSETTEEATTQQQQQQQLQMQPQQQQQQRYGAQQMLSPHDLAPRPLLAAAGESSLSEALRSLDSSAGPNVAQRSLSLQTGRAMEALYGAAPPPNGAAAQQLALAEPLPQLAELAFQELMNASSRANEDMQLHHADSTSAHGEAHDAAAMQMRPQQQQQLSAERASLDGAIVSLINGTSESHVRAEPNDMQT